MVWHNTNDIFNRFDCFNIHGYSGCGLKVRIVLTTRKMAKKIHQIGQKRKTMEIGSVCAYSETIARWSKELPWRVIIKKILMHNNRIIQLAFMDAWVKAEQNCDKIGLF